MIEEESETVSQYNPVATGGTVKRLSHYTKVNDDSHAIFVMSLTNCLRNRMWERGWQTELYGTLTAKSFMAFVEDKGRCGIGSSIPWIYSRLALTQKIDRKIPTAEALELLNAVLIEETGHDAKWHYEQKVIQETEDK
jgi:hypothetical protein